MAAATTGLTATTDRQKQIKKMLGDGKNPQQIAKALRISDNAVHQQLRRMRKNSGAKASGSTRSRANGSTRRSQTRASRSTGRKSTRTRTRSTARAASAPAATAPMPTPQTAEELIRSEIDTIKAGLAEQADRVKVAHGEIAAAEKETVGLNEELARREDTLAVLTGKKVASAKPKPRPKRRPAAKASGAAQASGNGKGTSGASKGAPASQPPAGDGNGGATPPEAPAEAPAAAPAEAPAAA